VDTRSVIHHRNNAPPIFQFNVSVSVNPTPLIACGNADRSSCLT
jgi:hypothetical protein